MEYFKEQAYTASECIKKIREKYGEGYTILIQNSIRLGGIFGLFSREGIEMQGYVTGAARYAPPPPAASRPLDPEADKKRMEEEKKKILAQAGKTDPAMISLLREVRADVRVLKDKLETGGQSGGQPARSAPGDHQTIVAIGELLSRNDFTPEYRAAILSRMRKEFSLETLEHYDSVQDAVLEWIGGSVKLYKDAEYHKLPRIMVLVGPTGVGKTTTIAKLAALFGPASKTPCSVHLITIDNYRIGAEQQIEKYGDIMQIPVSSVKSYNELKETIDMNAEQADMILIDTIGKSPRASSELGEMKQLLDACGGSAEYHLALMAATKSSDITEILQQFEPFGYRSVIITKIDETMRIGNVISVLAERGKAVSYITTGQVVPRDIQKADVMRFLINLDGFKINRKKFETLFPSGESENIQWRP
ncbi:MAG: flagellar biosynthesis protein FlhF [Treponema sp.]|jgi:flagellar biosynthesis protein FlhF|nr:flagellar biosynthesis protein FlhF [Treponema sp.]